LKVVFYSYAHFFDYALHFSSEISKIVDLYLLIEVPPESKKKNMLDLQYISTDSGLVEGTSVLANLFPSELIDELKNIKEFKLILHPNKKAFSLSTLLTNFKVLSFIEKIQPDIIHFDHVSIRSSFLFFFLRKKLIISNVHDPIEHTFETNWKIKASYKLAYPYIKKFIFFSNQYVKMFSGVFYGKKIFESKLGVYNKYRKFVTHSKKNGKKKILFFGRISYYKGIDVFLKALEIIDKQFTDIEYEIYGQLEKNFLMPKIPAYENKLNINYAYTSNSQLANLFNNAYVIVCPYLESTQSGVVMTSFAFFKPVIATNVGGLPEYVLDGVNGKIIHPNSPLELASALQHILTDEKYYYKLCTNIRKINNKKFNWEIIVARTKEIYNEILEDK